VSLSLVFANPVLAPSPLSTTSSTAPTTQPQEAMP
jgi:hypothetical protein